MEPSAPRIRVRPPGPRARKLIRLDERYISPCVTRFQPLAVASGSGTTVTDVDGNVFLDFTAGIAVNALGHSHPDIVAAIEGQARRFIHMAHTDFYYDGAAELARKLSEMTPGGPKKVFFGNSGTEAVEAAIKLAFQYTHRHKLIAFLGGFHGRTLGSLALTASKQVQRRGYPIAYPVVHVPYPDPYRPLLRGEPGEAEVRYIEEQIFPRLAPPEDVAAIIVEPMQGEGGYIVPPEGFLRRLRNLCTRHKIMLIVDEIQSGIGRTGKLFAYQHAGIEPDIICFAKGIAGGLPLGGIIAPARLHTWISGSHANTFGANPLACAAALVVLRHIEGGLLGNVRRMGALLAARLRRLVKRYDIAGDSRGLGLMQGLEIVRSHRSRTRAPALRNRIVMDCFQRGLLVMGAGANAIRFLPPLNVERRDLEAGLAIFEDVIRRHA